MTTAATISTTTLLLLCLVGLSCQSNKISVDNGGDEGVMLARNAKRGLGIYSVQCSDLQLLTNIGWAYNWAGQPGSLQSCYTSLGIQFIPMIWGLGSSFTNIYPNSPYLFTFNEPNFPQQSNMSPQQAAAAWPDVEKAAALYNMKIGSPSASYGGSNMDPIAWLDAFFAACTGCKVDFIVTHQYDCNAYSLYGAVGNFKKYGKPVWVTEFSCYGTSESQEVSYIKTILPLFDNDSAFPGYAWFGTRGGSSSNSLLNNTQSTLTLAGVAYNTV